MAEAAGLVGRFQPVTGHGHSRETWSTVGGRLRPEASGSGRPPTAPAGNVVVTPIAPAERPVVGHDDQLDRSARILAEVVLPIRLIMSVVHRIRSLLDRGHAMGRHGPDWACAGAEKGGWAMSAIGEQIKVARKNRGWSQARLAAALSQVSGESTLTGHYVSRWERGKRTPDYWLPYLAEVLDLDLGEVEPAGTGEHDAVGATDSVVARQDVAALCDPSSYPDFVGVLAAMAVGTVPPGLERLLPPPAQLDQGVPEIVAAPHVRMLRAISERHRQFDADHGGGASRDSAVAYLQWATGMLRSRCTTKQTERGLKAALSDMCQVAGWACHDLGDHAVARRYLTAGLALAREIDDLSLIAGAFYRLGRVSIHQGRAQEALRLWQLGQIVAQDSGCLVSVAILHANEAWAYAMLGADEHMSDALARAQSELGRVDADTAPSWARFFLAPADIDGISAVAYNSLARHPEHRAKYASVAIDRAGKALENRREGETRSQIFDAISLATGYVLDAQSERFAQYGNLAVDMASESASVRVLDRLGSMAGIARQYAAHSGVSGVIQRVENLALH